jgi:hypothetical protein
MLACMASSRAMQGQHRFVRILSTYFTTNLLVVILVVIIVVVTALEFTPVYLVEEFLRIEGKS